MIAVSNEIVRQAFSAITERMEQWPTEIWPFAEWIAGQDFTHALEIGVRHGGTAALWHGLVRGTVVGVDWSGPDSLGLQETLRLGRAMGARYPRYRLIVGDSHAPETLASVRAAFNGASIDFLFLDGDHSYEGVTRDWAMYRPLVRPGGVVAFHDIVDSPFIRSVGHGVYRFWQELRATERCREFSVHGDWGGIGAVVA